MSAADNIAYTALALLLFWAAGTGAKLGGGTWLEFFEQWFFRLSGLLLLMLVWRGESF